MDALLVGCLLRLLPAVRGRVVAQRGQLGLLVEQMLRMVDGLLPVADGRHQRPLRGTQRELVWVLSLDDKWES